MFKEGINPFSDNIFRVAKDGRIVRLHWKYKYQWMGMAAGIAGGVLSSHAAYQEGADAARAGELAYRQAKEESKATIQSGEYESREKRKEAERFKASQIATITAQGGKLIGSYLEVLAGTAANFEADARMIMRNYMKVAAGLRMQGAMAKYEGQMLRRGARVRSAAIGLQTMSSSMMGGMGGAGK